MDTTKLTDDSYSSDNFIEFIFDRFSGFELNNFEATDEDLSESEKKEIKSYRYLGSVELDDGKEIGFFEFLSKTPNIENKRVGFNKILKKFANEYILDGAIASFYHPDSTAWRLSFVGFEYDTSKVTNLKRYTYVLGKTIPTKTAYIQLNKLKYPKFDELKEIFSVEKVSNEFYEKYRNLFEILFEEVKSFKDLDEKKIELFAKKLLGRIIFLYFLQKKGWLGVEKEASWGEGKKDFLYFYFKKALSQNKNFYEEYLKKIFFNALNTKRENDYFELLDCKIPFLNGGLFEADELDNKLLYLDNSLFKKIFNTFNEYNFTIIEDSPDDKEVAIDPEMMGRVFENLLDENYRKGKGAFYTPREIVHYMCQQTIIDNLLNYFDNKEAITNLIIKKETDNEYIQKQGLEIKNRLLSLKILDMAIGSGAFPMGLLHEIVSTILALDKTMSQEEIAKLKRKIIENCIYGIDIDPSAVEIAKLRFWLSLVVDEDIPTPLPNLYYKIMVGNSLLESINGNDPLKQHGNIQEIKFLKQKFHKFFKTYKSEEKQLLKKEIERNILTVLLREKEKYDIQPSFNMNRREELTYKKNIENYNLLRSIIGEYTKNHFSTEVFLYKIYFKEVLDNGGFDIVIGNPPYIRQEKIKEIKDRLKNELFFNPITDKKEKYECFSGTADIYIYFFEKGFRLLSKNGILSFITSNKYTRAKYGAKFREFLLQNANIREYIDFNGVRVFESATVDTAILSFSRKKDNLDILYCDVGSDYKKEQNLFSYIQKKGFLYPQENLNKDAFTFLSPNELKIKKRIEEIGTPLKEWDIKIYRGILTGFNEAFIIDEDTKNKLIKEDKKSEEIIKPLLRGRDIKKYSYEFANLYLINAHNNPPVDVKNNYPAIYKWLLQFKDKLEKRWDKGDNWWNLRNCAYLDEFEKEKIVWAEMTDMNNFVWDSEKYYTNQTCYFMTNVNKYMLAVLNSKIIYFYIHIIASNLGTGAIRWIRQYVEKLPIPKIPKTKQKPFEKLVDIIIELKKQKDIKAKFFEDVVDIMVYELYFEEIKKENFDIIDIVSKDLENYTNDELFEKWSDRKHKVKKAIEFIDSIEVVKIVRGMG